MSKKKVTMKHIMLSLAILLMLITSSISVFANTPALQLTFLNQDPDPVGPGEYVDLKFRLDNQGTGSAENIEITFLEQFPFSLDPGVSATKTVSSIGPLQRQSTGVVIDYRIRVASDATQGNNEITVEFGANGQKKQSLTFDVEVKTQDSGLAVSSVSSDMLVPGTKSLVEIQLNNPSDATLRDVSISLDLDTDDLPFAPFDSATTKTVKFIRTGETSSYKFALVPYPNAESKVYRIPITMSYFDATNQLVTKNDVIGVVVGSEVELDVYAETEDFIAGSSRGTIILNFVNKGLIDVKFLDVQLQDTESYDVVSASKQYIGNVDSDDFETQDFILTKSPETKSFDIIADITYRDANNNPFTQTVTIPVNLFDSQESSSFSGIWVLVVLGIVGFIIYRWRKKRNAKK